MEETASPELGIKIKMLFFGPLAENMGQHEIEVALVMGSTTRDLIQRFRLTHLLDTGLRIAINGEIGADIDESLKDASEVAFLPPVSGG
ncbi:MAG: MoaD/ThiS family protein [Candidatus Thalassarchaeaceae archaeon]|nr:MoaD/ThiS family protein [Candidatus Thalassarchaeaceae archaeon]